jgi:hypothetical protein
MQELQFAYVVHYEQLWLQAKQLKLASKYVPI